jgi:hypothetical protein
MVKLEARAWVVAVTMVAAGAQGCMANEEDAEPVGESEAALRTIVNVKTYSDQGMPDGEAIDAALLAAKSGGVVHFEARPYRIGRDGNAPEKRWHRFHVPSAKNLRLEGHGATLLFTDETTLAFSFDQCRDIEMKDFIIDHETWPFAEAHVVGAPDDVSFVVALDRKSPAPPVYEKGKPYDEKLNVLPPKTKPANAMIVDARGRAKAHFEPRKVEVARKDARYRIFPAPGNLGVLAKVADNDRFVIARGFTAPDPEQWDDPGYEDKPAGDIVVSRCDGKVTFQGITFRSSIDKAFRLHDNDAKIVFRALELRPAEGRLVSAVRDGIHAKHNRGAIEVLGSHFAGVMDDAININTLPYTVAALPRAPASDDTAELLLNNTDFAYDYPVRCGDLLRFMPKAALRDDDANVGGAEGRTIADAIVIRLEGETCLPAHTGTREFTDVKRRAQRVTVKTTEKLGATHLAYNLSATNDGFHIAGSQFYSLANRAISATGASGIIFDNHVHGMGGGGIWLSNWTQVGAGPWARQVTVEKNEVYDPEKTPGIKLGAVWTGTGGQKMEVGATLKNNFVRAGSTHGIDVTNARGITLEGDKVEMPAASKTDSVAFHGNNVAAVSIKSLVVIDPRPGARATRFDRAGAGVTVDATLRAR